MASQHGTPRVCDESEALPPAGWREVPEATQTYSQRSKVKRLHTRAREAQKSNPFGGVETFPAGQAVCAAQGAPSAVAFVLSHHHG